LDELEPVEDLVELVEVELEEEAVDDMFELIYIMNVYSI
jgi:hypothetical protein